METHCSKILAYARSKPLGTAFKVADFTNACFTYEIGTRVGDLVRLGYLKKVGHEGKFAIYELVEGTGAFPIKCKKDMKAKIRKWIKDFLKG